MRTQVAEKQFFLQDLDRNDLSTLNGVSHQKEETVQ